MYGYEQLLRDMQRASRQCKVFSIGKSGGDRELLCAYAGTKKGAQVIITGAIHAREHITAKLVSALMLDTHAEHIAGGIYFLPMINPDGVELCLKGLKSVKSLHDRNYLQWLNGESSDFSLWKADMFGVDLNVNFPARYGTGRLNVNQAGRENYIGKGPLSQSESGALAAFIQGVSPDCVVCYHCKGEVIFWKFYQHNPQLMRDAHIARALSKCTGYELKDEEGSAGGVKDWCIQEFKIPAFTIEVGNDSFSHPFPYSEFDAIYRQNKDMPCLLTSLLI